MAAAAVARSVLRSPALHSGASRVVAVTTAASRPPFRCVPSLRPAIPARFFRSPVEASFCLESLMPMHSATASALMTSMLGVSRRRCGWLSEVELLQQFAYVNILLELIQDRMKLDERLQQELAVMTHDVTCGEFMQYSGFRLRIPLGIVSSDTFLCYGRKNSFDCEFSGR